MAPAPRLQHAGRVFSTMLLAGQAAGWVTQVQSKFGVQMVDVANTWEGNTTRAFPYSLPGIYGTMGAYWHWPEYSDDNRGLGGGIAWAWSDSLCKDTSDGNNLEDHFHEDFFFTTFIECADIKAAMHRAFKTWSDVNPHINFIDVTEECRRLYGHVMSNCSLVEVFVTLRNSSKDSTQTSGKPYPHGGEPYPYGDGGAVVGLASAERRRVLEAGASTRPSTNGAARMNGRRRTQDPNDLEVIETTSYNEEESSGESAASALQYFRMSSDLRSTNGHVQAEPAIETYGGWISFNHEKCWYLDSQFCAPLHALKRSMGTSNAQIMLRGLAFGVMGLALLAFALLVSRIVKHQHCCGVTQLCGQEKRSFDEKMHDTLVEINSWGVLPLGILLLSLCVPASLEVNIFRPCWSCLDFEAAAVHEVGHLLGLGHPNSIDTLPPQSGLVFPTGFNSHSTLQWSKDGMRPFDTPGLPEDACLNPWKYVVSGVPDDVDDVEVDGVRESNMLAFTEHNPSICLTPDDIEAINILYPVCTGRGITVDTRKKWACSKTAQRIGWVRVLVYIFVPAILVFIFLMLLLSFLKRHDEKVHRLKDIQILEHQAETKAAQKKAKQHHKASIALKEELHLQQETEDVRVEERAQELAAVRIQAIMRKKHDQKAVLQLKQSRDELIKKDPEAAAKLKHQTSSALYDYKPGRV